MQNLPVGMAIKNIVNNYKEHHLSDCAFNNGFVNLSMANFYRIIISSMFTGGNGIFDTMELAYDLLTNYLKDACNMASIKGSFTSSMPAKAFVLQLTKIQHVFVNSHTGRNLYGEMNVVCKSIKLALKKPFQQYRNDGLSLIKRASF